MNSRETPPLLERDFTWECKVIPRMHPQVLLWATRSATFAKGKLQCTTVNSPIEFKENVKYQFRLKHGRLTTAIKPKCHTFVFLVMHQCNIFGSNWSIALEICANAIAPEGQMSVALSVSSVQLEVYYLSQNASRLTITICKRTNETQLQKLLQHFDLKIWVPPVIAVKYCIWLSKEISANIQIIFQQSLSRQYTYLIFVSHGVSVKKFKWGEFFILYAKGTTV